MATDSHCSGHDPSGPDEPLALLPVLALSQPRRTLTRVDEILRDHPNSVARSYAGQARGIALRELGHVPAGIHALRTALQHSTAIGPTRVADVQASLAVTLVVAGRSEDGLRQLDAALTNVAGPAAARIRVRRGSLLGELGRPVEAAHELRAAARVLRRAGDGIWEARALLNLAMACTEVGDTRRADAALARAEDLLVDSDQVYEAAVARQDRGIVALLESRVPDALAHFDLAERRLSDIGSRSSELHALRASAYLSAGLYADALHSAEAAVSELSRPGSPVAHRPAALLRASEAALALGKPAVAATYAARAARLFARQGQHRGWTEARLCAAKARYAAGQRNRRLLRDLDAVAQDAMTQRMPHVVDANLLAGQLALELGQSEAGIARLRAAQRARRHASDLSKVLGWRAAALEAAHAHRRRRLLNACERGLQVLTDWQLTLGSLEARVAATTHGQPLAVLGLQAALSTDDPQLIFRWSERWRATALTLPPLRPSHDEAFAALLARLRLARSRANGLAAADGSRAPDRETWLLEKQVRQHALRTPGLAANVGGGRAVELDDLQGQLQDTRIVEVFVVDDAVHVLVVSAKSIEHHVTGSCAAALRAARMLEFAVRRLIRGDRTGRARGTAEAVGAALEKEVFGSAGQALGNDALVLVPPAVLSSTTWGLLPSLRRRPFSVAASAASWAAARRTAPHGSKVALIAGPGLRAADREIDAIAPRYADPTLIHAADATTPRVLSALEGARLAHIAAHGSFRGDNPMFSSVMMADGPLTVFDLQRLQRAPYRLVMACCETGAVGAAGADEILGVVSALTPLGTAGLIAATLPVPDDAGVPFASLVHQRLLAGDSTAQALCAARDRRETDPVRFAVAHSFVAYGAD